MTQNEALAIMHSGKSILLTGAAGTGKTYTLSSFIRRSKALGKNISVTATTGLAATHLNGTTIHSWAGIGINDILPKDFFMQIAKQRRDIICKTDILVIDEISMMHDFRLDLVDEVCRGVRSSGKPFGGIQIVLSGDFFQLPPVNRDGSRQGSFITASKVWRDGIFTICYLKEQHRQKDDQQYTDILNGIRSGFLSSRQIANLKQRSETVFDPWTTTTRLLTTNIDVDSINQQHLAELESESMFYDMTTSGSKKYVDQLLRSCLAPQTLELKVGAHVMCIKNSIDKKYVNGSLGVVESFEKDSHYPVIRFNNNKLITIKPDTWELIDGDRRRASIVQLPLRLAWAITVHKSQGMTLDSAQIDLSRAFVEGMGYVALSRVKNMKSLKIDGLNRMAFQVSNLAKQIDADLQLKSDIALTEYADIIKQWKKTDHTSIPTANMKKSMTWSEKLALMRQEFPNAYTPWSEADDRKLVSEFSNGKNITELSLLLGRHKGSIRSRLNKHFGEDLFK